MELGGVWRSQFRKATKRGLFYFSELLFVIFRCFPVVVGALGLQKKVRETGRIHFHQVSSRSDHRRPKYIEKDREKVNDYLHVSVRKSKTK